jgi:acid phosphatase
LLAKLDQVHLKGSLSFINNWTYFVDPTEPGFDGLTSTGPYAGTSQAYSTGQSLRQRYNQVVNASSTIKFWSCGSPRDIVTAKLFADGFFGDHWQQNESAYLHIIPESAERGGDTLTPGDTCLKYREDKIYGHDYGYREMGKWQNHFSKSIAARLREDAGGLDFTPIEVYGMMEFCGFELLVRGSSPWCDVFTQQEWLDYEYARDLLHYYRAGPGNQYAGAMGWLWLDATKNLLTNESATGVYFSFVHDVDMILLVTTMGIFDEQTVTQNLPTDHIKDGREWRTSDVVPMSGRFIFEKIVCKDDTRIGNIPRTYVRLFINDGLFDLEKVIGGSGLAGSASLNSFQQWVFAKGERFGDFGEICGLEEGSPTHISFLHQ